MANEKNRPKIIHVDDDEDFMILFRQMFEDWLDIHWVNNFKDALTALKSKKYDLLISDFNFPDKNGFDLIETLRNEFIDIPFIFCTAQGNEEIARQAFLKGASDYFNKDFSTLSFKEKIISSIQNIIKKNQAEESLRLSERRYKRIANLSPAGIGIQTDGRFVFMNTSGLKLLGLKKQNEVLSKPVTMFVHPDSQQDLLSIFRKLTRRGTTVFPAEQKWLKPDGGTLDMEISASPIIYEGKDAIQIIFNDISKQKQAEDYLIQLNNIFLKLGNDYSENVKTLLNTCGTLLDAVCIIYNILEDRKFHTLASYNPPRDFRHIQNADPGSIYYDAINNNGESLIIRDLESSHYFNTDPNIKLFNYKSYIGHPISIFGKPMGTLSVFFNRKITVNDGTKKIISILSSLLTKEEDRKALKEALKKSERKFRSLSELIPGYIFDIDWKGNIISQNEPAEEKFGYSRADIKQRVDIFLLFRNDFHSEIKRGLKKIINDGTTIKQEMTACTKNGATFPVAVTFRPIIKKNRVNFIRVIIEENTGFCGDGKKYERLKEDFNKLFSGIEEPLIFTDVEGNITRINKTAKQLIDPSKLKSLNFLDIIHEEDNEKILDYLERVLLSDNSERIPIGINPSGKKIPVLLKTVKTCDDPKTPTGFIHFVNPAVAGKDSHNIEHYCKTVFDSANICIFIKDRDQKYIKVNHAMEKLFNMPESEITGRTDSELFDDEATEHIKAVDLRVLEGHTIVEEHDKPVNGIMHSFHITKVPLMDSNNRVIGICGIAADITNRKNMEMELINKNRELSDFAHTISHELKNPLNLMKGYLTILKDNPDLFNDNFERMDKQINFMVHFINNLLHLSRSGRIIDQKQRIDLEKTIREIYKSLKPENCGNEIEIEPGIFITGAPASIRQVFTNLIQNSILHSGVSPENLRIKISAEKHKNEVIIGFEDNGPGIKEEIIDKIFNPGFTLSRNKGTGFGLPIARKIIEAHNGRIWAESRKDGGALFNIKLPSPEGS